MAATPRTKPRRARAKPELSQQLEEAQRRAPAPKTLEDYANARFALTRQEAGELLGVSFRTIREEIGRGRLRAMRVGDRRIRITVEAIRAYIKVREKDFV